MAGPFADSSQYKETIRELSERLVEAQRPIRILNEIKWDQGVQEAFFNANCREQPPVSRAYYEQRPLPYDPAALRLQFHEIERDIVRILGQYNPAGVIMRRMCREYQMAVRMLEARGTPEFSGICQELYGSSTDAFHAGDPSIADLGILMSDALTNIRRTDYCQANDKALTGDEVVVLLQDRIATSFPDSAQPIRVVLSDGIIADAAAGSDYLKIRSDARFSARDLRILEVHEGWVHLGTTFNGRRQPVCTFLSKGPPSSVVTQEGLALLMEILAFASYPDRLRRITNRVRAVHMAEEGATFLDVFHFYREQGLEDADSYAYTVRVFRGSTPVGGPFTKDLSYAKGFVQIYTYVMLAVRRGMLERIPLLFCGKTALEDLKTLAQLVDEGLVAPPEFLPPQFADLDALATWMCLSNFLNRLNLERIESDYANIL